MKRYFVVEVYVPGGAKTMERNLCEVAKREFLHNLIHEERIPTVVEHLKWNQDEILRNNRRLTPVEIKFYPEENYHTGHCTITMGMVHIQMQLVKGEYE